MPPLTIVQPFNNEMFDTSGIRNKEVTGGTYAGFKPMVEEQLGVNTGETGVAICANRLYERLQSWRHFLNPDFRFFGFSAARGGAALSQLDQGSVFYINMINAITDAYNLSVGASETFGALVIGWLHGERDQELDTPRATYSTGVVTLHADMVTDIQAVTGQAYEMPMLIGQLCSHMHYHTVSGSSSRPTIALAQNDVAASDANAFVVFPCYIFTLPDNVHYNNESHKMSGLYIERAQNKIIDAQLSEKPIPSLGMRFLSAAWITDRHCRLTFEVPWGPLVFDDTWVSAVPNRGFQHRGPDGFTIIDDIVDVVLPNDACNAVDVFLSADAGSGDSIVYAFGNPAVDTGSGRTSGVAGNLRDSEGDVDYYESPTLGHVRLDNYCPMFETIKP